MNPGKLQFSTYDLFRKQDVVLQQLFTDKGYTLQVRPFWISGDLQQVYLWMRNGLARRNTGMGRDQQLFFSYYRFLIESDTAQPLMVAADGKDLVQVSIIPAQHDAVKKYTQPKALDCCIQYIINLSVTDAELICHCFFMACRYFFEPGNTGDLFLFIPSVDSKCNDAALDGGFHFLESYHTEEGRKNLYVLTLEAFQKKENRLMHG